MPRGAGPGDGCQLAAGRLLTPTEAHGNQTYLFQAFHLIKAVSVLLNFSQEEENMLKETLEYKVGFPGLLSAFQKLVSHPSPGRWEQCTAALLPWKVPLDDELDWGSAD